MSTDHKKVYLAEFKWLSPTNGRSRTGLGIDITLRDKVGGYAIAIAAVDAASAAVTVAVAIAVYIAKYRVDRTYHVGTKGSHRNYESF